MEKKFHILIADRNPHVRELLKREMTAEGYVIQVAGSGREVINRVYGDDVIDLLILDPDLPDTESPVLIEKLRKKFPSVPVVFHTFLTDEIDRLKRVTRASCVEKGAKSIERLKSLVSDLFK